MMMRQAGNTNASKFGNQTWGPANKFDKLSSTTPSLIKLRAQTSIHQMGGGSSFVLP
jgi:hypothetical protein